MKRFLNFLMTLPLCTAAFAGSQWTPEQAAEWGKHQPWRVGANFAPGSAVNQLEMWQAATFDPVTIDRELGYAEGAGLNGIRVFLHNLLWEQDSEGLLKRMDQFLAIADKHHIAVMFVLFDDVWDPQPQLGPQRAPRPHVHNSGWVQSPGREVLQSAEKRAALEPYVKGVLSRFKDDKRIFAWDLYNEPGNGNNEVYARWEPKDKPKLSLELAKSAFQWAWDVRPSQPLTMGVWTGDWVHPDKMSDLNTFQLDHSDIVTFHMYSTLERTKEVTEALFRYNRPVICTEYLARPAGSRLQEILPYFKERHVGALQRGLVAGKTQTQYPWDSWDRPYDEEPKVWFHEIFHPDGTPYDPEELELYRKLTKQP